jgi:hypothetical protein
MRSARGLSNTLPYEVIDDPRLGEFILAKATFSIAPGVLVLDEDSVEAFHDVDRVHDAYRTLICPADRRATSQLREIHVTSSIHAPSSLGSVTVRAVLGGCEETRVVTSNDFDKPVHIQMRSAEIDLRRPVVLESLNLMVPVLATQFPGLTAKALIDDQTIRLTPGMIWVDCDRARLSVTFIGRLSPSHGERRIQVDFVANTEMDSLRQGTVEVRGDSVTTTVSRAETVNESALPFATPAQRGSPPEPRPAMINDSPQLVGARWKAKTAAALPSYLKDAHEEPGEMGLSIVSNDPLLSEATRRGASAASDAAAAPKSAPARKAEAKSASTLQSAVQLVWLDERRINDITEWPAWVSFAPPVPAPAPPAKPVRGQAPPPPVAPDTDGDARRQLQHIASAMSAGPLTHPSTAGRPSPEGRASLALFQTEITMDLELPALLETTAELANPLAGNDKRLKDLLDAVREVSKLPLAGTPDFVLQLIHQIRDAWSRANRTFPPQFLVANAERKLLMERTFTRRSLFGETHVRAYAGAGDGAALPLYVPESAVNTLPLALSFSARVIVEVHPTQDSGESSPLALRVLAIGRRTPSADGSAKPQS